MSNPKSMIEKELEKRINTMSTDQLLSLYSNETPAQVIPLAKTGVLRGRPPKQEGELTIGGAILQVCRASRSQLTTAQIVEQVQVVRQGSAEPSIRAEISHLARVGELAHYGPARGGAYAIAKKSGMYGAARANTG